MQPSMVFRDERGGVLGYEELRTRHANGSLEDSTRFRFSPKRAIPTALLHGSDPRDLRLELCITREGQTYTIDGDADYCVTGETIVPIATGLRAELSAALVGLGVTWPGRINLADYFRIRTESSVTGLIDDHVTIPEDWATNYLAAADIQIPDSITATLYPYQRIGYAFMKILADMGLGSLLADEMGLGKTLQVIALAAARRDPGKKTLVVAPASLLTNWRREIAVFDNALITHVHAGPRRAGSASSFPGCDVVITSYETVVSDLPFLEEIEWDMVVLDEAQWIKNPGSRRAVAVKSLPRRVGVAVTGTPVENTLSDLASLLTFVAPMSVDSFVLDGKVAPGDVAQVAEALGNRAAPLTIRRRVADVASDLPPLTQHHVLLDMDAQLASSYEEVAPGEQVTLQAITAARIVCAHAEEPLAREFWMYPKVALLLDLLSEAFGNREKVLVFASFSKSLDRIRDTVVSRFPCVHADIVDGRIGPDDRQAKIDSFTSSIRPGILIMNPRAAGVGLNITAATHVVHFTPEWNPAVTSQATARSYRRKQKRPVVVHHLYYGGTVEERAVQISETKQELAGQVDVGIEEG